MTALYRVDYNSEGKIASKELVYENISSLLIICNDEYEINGNFHRDGGYCNAGGRRYYELSNGDKMYTLLRRIPNYKFGKLYTFLNGKVIEEGKKEVATFNENQTKEECELIGYVLFGKFYQTWDDVFQSDDFDGRSHKECYSLEDVAKYVAIYQDNISNREEEYE